MLYDNYLDKVKKAASVKNGIIRFRFVILAVIALIIAATTSYTATKGTLPNGITIPDSFVYGQSLDYSANPLMSEVVGFEFRQGDGEWTSVQPTDAGSYEIRAITKKVGGNRYSKPQAFVINPKPLKINLKETEIPYGELVEPKIEGLAGNDQISGISFTYESITEQKTVVNPVITGAKVVNDKGVDVTKNYAINNEGIAITYKPKLIELTPDTLGKVYDGKPVDYQNTFTITKGNNNSYDGKFDNIEMVTIIKNSKGEVVNEAITPDTYTVEIENVTIKNDGNIQNNYEVQKKSITFDIEKRALDVTTGSNEFIYDGENHKELGFTLGDNQLLEGHEAKVIDNDDVSKVKYFNDTAIDNKFEIQILDSEGNDVSSYYDLKYTYGSIKINRRDVNITALGKEFIYDGTEHFNLEATAVDGQLVGDDRIVVDEKSKITLKDAGNIQNTLSAAIYNGENDLSNNYNISYTYEDLVVKPMELKLQLNQVEGFVYNGEDYIYDSKSFTILEGSLPEGEDIELSYTITNNDEEATAINNSGAYVITPKDYIINNGLHENYTVSYEANEVKFEIAKLKVNVAPIIEENVVFDNTEYIYNNTFECQNETSFIYDGEIKLDVQYEINDEVVLPINANTYKVKAVGISEGVLRNHEVIYDQTKEFTISKRAITISPYINSGVINTYNAKEYLYDSTAYVIYDNQDNVALDPYTLPWGGEISEVTARYEDINGAISPVDCGTYNVYLDTYKYTGEDNYDITISPEYTNLVISKRHTTIKASLNSLEKMYDGIAYEYDNTLYEVIEDNGEAISSNTLFNNNTIEVTYDFKDLNEISFANPLDASTYDVLVASYNASDLIKRNFEIEISTEAVEYTITPVPLTIRASAHGTCEYYTGSKLIYDETNYDVLSETKLVNDDALDITTYTDVDPINVGTYLLHINDHIRMSKGNRFNYSITREDATIEVTKRPIKINAYLPEPSKIYDSLEYVYDTNYFTVVDYNGDVHNITNGLLPWDGQLVDGLAISYNDSTILPLNAGEYIIKLTSVGALDNYEVSYDNLELSFTIDRREITLKPYIDSLNSEKIYDAVEMNYDLLDYKVIDIDSTISDSIYNEINSFVDLVAIAIDLNGNVVESIVNAGTYKFYGIGYTYENETKNYNISNNDEFAEYTILKKDIKMIPSVDDYQNLIYNGNEITLTNKISYVEGFAPIGDDTFTITTSSLVNELEERVVNAHTYTLRITSHQFEGGVSADNYNVLEYVDNEFTISRRSVVITTVDHQTTYNGNPFNYIDDNSFDYYKVTDYNGDTLYNNLPCTNVLNDQLDSIYNLNVVYKLKDGLEQAFGILPINAGIYLMKIDSYSFTEYVDINYDITIEENEANLGILTLDKCELYIEPVFTSNTMVYTGESFLYENSYRVYSDTISPVTNMLPFVNYNLGITDTIDMSKLIAEYFEGIAILDEVRNAGTYFVKLSAESIIAAMDELVANNYSLIIPEAGVEIEITPRPIIVSPIPMPEDVDYTYRNEAFVYDPTRFLITDEAGAYVITPEDLGLTLDVIYKKNGEVVTSMVNAGIYEIYADTLHTNELTARNYSIDYSLEAVQFEILKREIRISANINLADLIYYTGNQVIYNQESFKVVEGFEPLVNGEEVVEAYTNTIGDAVNAGSYDVVVDLDRIVFNGNIDNYYFTSETAQVVITPRPVEIKTVDQGTRAYDGTLQIYNNEYIAYDILDNKNSFDSMLPCVNSLTGRRDMLSSVEVDYYKYVKGTSELMKDTFTDIADAGKYKVFAVDAKADEVTLANYSFIYTTEEAKLGNVEITPITVLITPTFEVYQRPYNANMFEYKHTYTVSYNGEVSKNMLPFINRLSGTQDKLHEDSLILIFDVLAGNGSLKGFVNGRDVASYNVYFDTTRINSSNALTNDNYIYETDPAVVEITKRDVEIAPRLTAEGKIYDGDEFVYNNALFKVVKDNNEAVDKTALLNNEKLIINTYAMFNGLRAKEILDAGAYNIYIDSIDFPDPLTENNYNVTSTNAVTYTIERRNVTIKPVVTEDRLTYNGQIFDFKALPGANYQFIINDKATEGLVKSDRIVSIDTYAMLDTQPIDNIIDAGAYTIYFDEASLEFEGRNSSNYNFIYKFSDLVMNQREVVIRTHQQDSVVYDGEFYLYNGYFYAFDKLTSDVFENKLPCVHAVNGQDNITSLTIKYVLDGKDAMLDSIVNRGLYRIVIQNDSDITYSELIKRNYIITAEVDNINNGTIEITPAEVVIAPVLSSGDLFINNRVYDNTPFSYSYGYYSYDADGNPYLNSLPFVNAITKDIDRLHEKELAIIYYQNGSEIEAPTNAGNYEINLDLVSINSDEITNNNYTYRLKENTQVVIEKRIVEVMPYMENRESTYGEEITYNPNLFQVVVDNGSNVFDKGVYNLIANDKLVLDYEIRLNNVGNPLESMINVGTYYIKAIGHVADEIIDNNYEIIPSEKLFAYTINRLQITIKPEFEGLASDGFLHLGIYDNTSKKLPINENINSLPLGDEIKFTFDSVGSLVNAGDHEVKVINYEFTKGTADNYEITEEKTIVKIDKGSFVISPISQNAIYTGQQYVYPGSDYIIRSINGIKPDNDKLLLAGEMPSLVVKYDGDADVVGRYTITGTGIEQDEIITNNYNITYEGTATLTINRRRLTLDPGTIIYPQGLTLKPYEYDIKNLIEGISNGDDLGDLGYNRSYTTLKVHFEDLENNRVEAPMEMGHYQIVIDDVIIVKNGVDLTANYEFDVTEFARGSLEIYTRDINIALHDDEITYNGKDYIYSGTNIEGYTKDIMLEGINVEGTLVDGDLIYVDIQYYNDMMVAYPMGFIPRDAGTYYFTILGSHVLPEESSDRYDISYDSGLYYKLIINKKEIKVVGECTNSLEFNFDILKPNIVFKLAELEGNALFNDDKLDLANITPSFMLGEVTDTTVFNAGTYRIYTDKVDFITGNALNYNVVVDGEFTVNKLKVNVELSNILKQYDEKFLKYSNDQFKISYTDPSIIPEDLDFGIKSVLFSNNKNEVIDAGRYTVKGLNLVAYNGYLSDNFEAVVNEASYVINKRDVIVNSQAMSITYDSLEHAYTNYTVTMPEGITHQIKLSFSYNSINKLPIIASDYKVNYLSYEEYYTEFDNVSGEDRIITYDTEMKNFNIIMDEALMTINRLDISLKAADRLNEIYNNKEINGTTEFVDVDGKIIPDTISAKVSFRNRDTGEITNSIINVGSYYMVIDYESITMNNRDSYSITLGEEGIIVINKSTIRLSIDDINTTYGDSYNPSFTLESDLINGFSIDLIYTYYNQSGELLADKPTDAGSYTIYYSNFIVKLDGKVVGDNSNFSLEVTNEAHAALEIARRQLTINLINKDNFGTYNGEAHERLAVENEYSFSGLAGDDLFEATPRIYLDKELYEGELIHAGTYYLDIALEDIVFTSGSKANYDIRVNRGSYVIAPKVVTVSINIDTDMKTYDGKAIDYSFTFVGNPLIGEDKLTPGLLIERRIDIGEKVEIEQEILNAGQYTIRASGKYTIESSISNTNDYVVESDIKFVTINKRSISIKTGSIKAYFTGYPISCTTGFEVVGNQGLVLDSHRFEFDSEKDFTTVLYPQGPVKNVVTPKIMDGDKDITFNYAISTDSYGYIEVIKRPVHIIGESAASEYMGSRGYLSYDKFSVSASLDKLDPNIIYGELNPEVMFYVTDKTNLNYCPENPIKNVIKVGAKLKNRTISRYFTFDYEYGTLNLTPKTIQISLYNKDNEGRFYTGKGIDTSIYFIVTDINGNIISLPDTGDKIDYISSLSMQMISDKLGSKYPTPIDVSSFKNAGTYRLTLKEGGIRIVNAKNSNKDVSQNYDVILNETNNSTEATIRAIGLDVSTSSSAKVWDQFDYVNHDLSYSTMDPKENPGFGLIKGQTIEVDENDSRNAIIRSMENGQKVTNKAIKNELYAKIYDGSLDVTDNYIITYSYGTIAVVDTIYKLDYSTEYNGSNQNLKGIEYSAYGMVDGDIIPIDNLMVRLDATCKQTVKDPNAYSLDRVIDSEEFIVNNTVTKMNVGFADDLEINFNVSKITIYIKPIDKTVEYNGQPQTILENEYEIFSGNILDEHELRIYAEYQNNSSLFLGIGTRTFYIKNFKIFIKNTETEIQDMYYNVCYDTSNKENINDYRGKLTVTQRALDYATDDIAAFEYDGKVHTYGEANIKFKDLANQLLPGHKVVIGTVSFKDCRLDRKGNVTSYTNNIPIDIVDTRTNRSVRGFYNLRGDLGKVTINKRNIYITTGSIETEWTGQKIYLDSWKFDFDDPIKSGLCEGHTLTKDMLVLDSWKINPGSVDNVINLKKSSILDENGKNVIDNYNMTGSCITIGKITVL